MHFGSSIEAELDDKRNRGKDGQHIRKLSDFLRETDTQRPKSAAAGIASVKQYLYKLSGAKSVGGIEVEYDAG